MAPAPGNQLHLNSVYCDPGALYLSGLRTGGLHAYTGRYIRQVATLPPGTHNARPFRDGVLFNDTRKNLVRFVPAAGEHKAFRIPVYNPALLTHTGGETGEGAEDGVDGDTYRNDAAAQLPTGLPYP